MTGPASIDLTSLLADEAPISNPSLILCDAELDTPLGYIFESDGAESWIEAVGAGKQLAALPNKLSAALPTGSVILQSDAGRLVALVPDSKDMSWTGRLAQVPPQNTGIVTLSVGVTRLTARQTFGGLYRAPENVIGIPGMTVHQARVNRYYHVDSPSTIPPADSVAARRNFGEAIRLARHLTGRAREERTLVPFYECLPLYERCSSCRTRPAEPGSRNTSVCGVCRRKREAAGKLGKAHWAAVINVRLPDANKMLLEQRTPGAYQRMAATIGEAWRKALFEAKKHCANAETLWQTCDAAWLIAPATEALSAVRTVCSALGMAHFPGNLPICVGIALGERGTRTLHTMAEMAAADALADVAKSKSSSAIRLRLVNEPDVFQSGTGSDDVRYSLEALDKLNTAARNLATRHFPLDAFSELPGILARQTVQAAALYFEHTRSRLDERVQGLLDPLRAEFNATWGVDTPRYFHALADVFGLQALMQQAMYS